tara:strand:+ start:2502 stop:3191 length:690 start_codon:yes stop_codon:yes gene_type:complete
MAGFAENSNKSMIWNMLLENGTFNKLTNEQKPQITENFDKIVGEINSAEPNETLVNKNKSLILKITEVANTMYNSSPMTKSTPITSSEIINLRQEQFSDSLKNKQTEFDTFMKRETPSDIDFSDKLDKPIGNLDSMMSQAMASREIDMNMNFPPPPPKNTPQASSNKFVTNLVIGDTVDISSEPIKIETAESLQLKTILERLNVIQNNQDKIMNQLTTLNGDELFKDSK